MPPPRGWCRSPERLPCCDAVVERVRRAVLAAGPIPTVTATRARHEQHLEAGPPHPATSPRPPCRRTGPHRAPAHRSPRGRPPSARRRRGRCRHARVRRGPSSPAVPARAARVAEHRVEPLAREPHAIRRVRNRPCPLRILACRWSRARAPKASIASAAWLASLFRTSHGAAGRAWRMPTLLPPEKPRLRPVSSNSTSGCSRGSPPREPSSKTLSTQITGTSGRNLASDLRHSSVSSRPFQDEHDDRPASRGGTRTAAQQRAPAGSYAATSTRSKTQ